MAMFGMGWLGPLGKVLPTLSIFVCEIRDKISIEKGWVGGVGAGRGRRET